MEWVLSMLRTPKIHELNKVADIYLDAIYKAELKKLPKLPAINNVLENNNIFFDRDMIDGVVKKLNDKGLIEPIPNSISVYGYPHRNIKDDGKIPDINKAEGMELIYKLTDKGFAFKNKGQVIDIDGVKRKIDNRRNVFIAVLIYVFGILSGIAINYLSELLK